MNVAALLQDSPSDDRRRNSGSSNSNGGNNQQQLQSTNHSSNPSSRTPGIASHSGSNAGTPAGWRRTEDGTSGAHGHGLTTTRQTSLVPPSSSSSSSPVLSRLNTHNHNRTLSQPTLLQQPSPSLPHSATLPTVGPRGGVWGPAPGRLVSGPLGPDARGEQFRIADSTLPLPRRDPIREMDRERDREKDQPRILNIMDWQGERDRSKSGDERERLPRRPLLGGPEDLSLSTLPPLKSHSQSPIMRATSSRRSSSSGGPIVDEGHENDVDYIRPPGRRHGSSRPGSAPTETEKAHLSSGPPPPRNGDFPYHAANFQPPSHPHHFVPAVAPLPGPVLSPAPGTLSLVPPQHQQSHQQHQLAQAQAQQQQIHVNAQGPVPIHAGPSTSGSNAGVMEPRGGVILNLNGPTQNGPPQKQFQNQFHTQFLPGLQLGPSASSSLPPRERERGHDRDRERENENGSVRGLLSSETCPLHRLQLLQALVPPS
ncbi:hypothetical protein GGU11DRAFT_69505 [Lentinula aff. detonsa]|nr:hypothetical protein GGU11DRAFT_69505 [Lentinula aff. detonsa]